MTSRDLHKREKKVKKKEKKGKKPKRGFCECEKFQLKIKNV